MPFCRFSFLPFFFFAPPDMTLSSVEQSRLMSTASAGASALWQTEQHRCMSGGTFGHPGKVDERKHPAQKRC